MSRSMGWLMLCVPALMAGCGSSGEQAAGPSPQPAVLTRHDAEPAGANCQLGGTAIRVGLDRNADGTLEDSEVDHTDYLCNPATAVLVRKDPLPASLQCPDGGVAVQTGVDTNGDGILEDGEITQTTQVCSSLELWDGDFTEADWNDPVKVAALQGARVVVGSLTFHASGPVTLPALEVVSGTVVAGLPTSVPTLPALRQVGGGLAITTDTTAPALPMLAEVDGAVAISTGTAALDLPALAKIGGDLGVNPGTAAVTFDVLDEVHGQLFIHGHSALVDASALRDVDGGVTASLDATGVLSLPGLQTIGGDVLVQGALTGLHADHLVLIGGKIKIDGRDAKLALALPALQTITGDVTAIFATGLTSIDLPQLQQLGGTLELSEVPGLTEVSLPHVLTIGGDLQISEALALATVDVSALATVGGAIEIDDAPVLSTLSLRALVRVGAEQTVPTHSISVSRTALEDLDFASLHDVTAGIFFDNNLALRTLQFPSLVKASTISANAHDSFAAPKLTTIQNCDLGGGFQSLDLGALQSATVLQLNDAAVADLSGLHSLSTVSGLLLMGLTRIQDLHGLTSLQHVSSLWLSDNPALTSLDGLEQLTEMAGSVRLMGNGALTSVAGLRNVTQIGLEVFVFDEPALPTLELTSLVSIGGNQSTGGLILEQLPALTTLSGLGALRSLGGKLSILDTALSTEDINAFVHRIGR